MGFHPVEMALFAGLFTFFITALGSALVFLFKNIYKTIMDIMLSLSAGIMLAASFFSLLNPAILMAKDFHMIVWLVILIGFLTGGFALFIGEKILSFYSKKIYDKKIVSFKRCIMLFTSISLHNIPEGLVIGVAFGSCVYGDFTSNVLSAIILTIGIAIQNFPEGCAISLPMRRENVSRWKSFLFGAFSAIVEPVFAVVGAFLVLKVQLLLPFIMSFTAGAMIFVITMELIPESQTNEKKGLMTLFDMLGFSFMMILELILG